MLKKFYEKLLNNLYNDINNKIDSKVRLNKYNTEMMEQNIDFRIIDVIHQRFNDDKMREIFYEYSEIYINQNMEKIKKEILSNDIIQLIIDEINRRQIK